MRLIGLVGLALGIALTPIPPSSAQSYPNRPPKLVVPFPAGGPTDVVARIVAQALGGPLGYQVVIDNRAGAGGNLGAEVAAHAPPDGYTMFFATGGTHGINPSIYKHVDYDPLRDFAPVALIASSPNIVVVNPAMRAHSIRDLIDLAKAAPRTINFASAGSGTTTHMTAELLQMMAGIALVHVPYRGGAQALNDVVSGQIELMVDGMPSAMPFVRDGRLRALAISSRQRSPAEPGLPTIAETVPGFEALAWYGIAVPTGTPGEIIARLNHDINAVLAEPALRRRYAELGADPLGGTPADMDRQTRSELVKWAEVVKATGAKID